MQSHMTPAEKFEKAVGELRDAFEADAHDKTQMLERFDMLQKKAETLELQNKLLENDIRNLRDAAIKTLDDHRMAVTNAERRAHQAGLHGVDVAEWNAATTQWRHEKHIEKFGPLKTVGSEEIVAALEER